MLSRFIHPGDQFLAVSSDQSTVNAYAVRTKDGNVRIMLVNDRASNQYAVNVDMPGYRVKPGGRVYSFGPGQRGIHVAHAHAGLTLPGYTVTVFTLSLFAATNSSSWEAAPDMGAASRCLVDCIFLPQPSHASWGGIW